MHHLEAVLHVRAGMIFKFASQSEARVITFWSLSCRVYFFNPKNTDTRSPVKDSKSHLLTHTPTNLLYRLLHCIGTVSFVSLRLYFCFLFSVKRLTEKLRLAKMSRNTSRNTPIDKTVSEIKTFFFFFFF